MSKQVLVSSLDDTAFGADLAAGGPFDFLRRLWNSLFRANTGREQSPARERNPAVRESRPAAPRAKKPAEPEVSRATAVLDEPRQPAPPDPAPSATLPRPSRKSEPRPPLVSDDTRELRRQCESILHSLRQSSGGAEGGPRLIGLTSCYPGEGVTTLATHLALAAAVNHRRVLLADLNFDAPAVHTMFRTSVGPGLTECLGNGRPWEDILQAVPGCQLTLATAGAERAGQAAAVERLRDLVRFAGQQFDFAVFDLPPLNRLSDTLPVGELLDGVLLLIESERVRWPVAKRLVTGLERSARRPWVRS